MISDIKVTTAGTFLTIPQRRGNKRIYSENEILYIEGNSFINVFVKDLSPTIKESISKIRNVNILSYNELISGDLIGETIKYNYPDSAYSPPQETAKESICTFWNKITDQIEVPKTFGAFLYFGETGRIKAYLPITENPRLLQKGMEAFGKYTALDEEYVCYYSRIDEIDDIIGGPKDIDKSFRSEVTNRLMDEITERVNQLRLYGVREYVIRSLFDHPVALSHVLISNDFRIFLTDYENMEITMEPLPKAIWLLFLKHPEGMLLKQLYKHEEELRRYYNMISKRCDQEALDSSISRLLDSTDNSVNEKCSRIKAAFVSKFDEKIAHHYYVDYRRLFPGSEKSGNQDPLAKGIALDRSLVTYEFE